MTTYTSSIKTPLFLIGGTILILILSCFSIFTFKQDDMIRHTVYLSAEHLFKNIVLLRRWNARYGGVFVLKQDGMQSNPYLKHPDIESVSGKIYTLKNPALMTREVSELAIEAGEHMYHITSLKLMNPQNKPDGWERQSLAAFETGATENFQITEINGKKVFRMIRPLIVEDSCLQCHGEQGYTAGEVRGGISVMLPYDRIDAALAGNHRRMLFLAGLTTATFCLLFYFGVWRLVNNLIQASSELSLQKKQLEHLNITLDQKVIDRTAELRESEHRFRNTFEQAPVGISHLDGTGNFLRMNRQFLNILGYDEEELRQHSYQSIFAATLAPEYPDTPDQFGQNALYGKEIFYTAKDGHNLWLDITLSPVFKETGTLDYCICVIRDISEYRTLVRQLQQAQKMEAIGTLAGGIAHDYNNMLNVIMGYSELALKKVAKSDPLYNDLQEIRTAAQRSADVTRQLLAFARKQTVRPRELDLNEAIEHGLNMLKHLIGENIELVWKPDPALWRIRLDPSQIDQILTNLCINAAAAIADIGRITITTTNVSILTEVEDYTELLPGNYVRLTFSDNGCGMDQETLCRIFEPFFTTKKTGEGTGLGLATIYGIVRQNNGVITVDSKPDAGTTFNIFLPKYDGDFAEKIVQESSQAQSRKELTILLVEDEPAILAVAERMLTRHGFKVLTANKAADALRMAETKTIPIDLLITDIIMPKMNGRDLANQIITLRPDIKHLFMSGYTSSHLDGNGEKDEDLHFIQKPFSKAELLTKVTALLGQAKSASA